MHLSNYLHNLIIPGYDRREPLFPVQLWSQHIRTLRGEDRTNNFAEAAHRKLYCELGMCHPTIWVLIDALRAVQRQRDRYLEYLNSGNEPQHKRNRYQVIDDKLLKVVQGCEDRDSIPYLRAVAHTYNLK